MYYAPPPQSAVLVPPYIPVRDLQTRLPVTVRNYPFYKCVKRVTTAFVIRYSQKCGNLLYKNCQDQHLR